jgi:hypothetical protein
MPDESPSLTLHVELRRLLEELVLEVRGLRADLAALAGAPRGDGDGAAAALLAAIYGSVADRIFSAGDLLIHSKLPIGEAIDVAIVASIGIANARRLGKLFARIEGRNLGGYVCRRVSSDGAGIAWSVRRVS